MLLSVFWLTWFHKLVVKKGLEPGLPVLGKAILAIDRPALSGLEGYFAFFTAV
jgi:hypothetical protein